MDKVFTAVNYPGLLARKAADFLFGDAPTYTTGGQEDSDEQKALERLVSTNRLNTQCYESAMSNSFRGDAFFKIRWAQEYEGILDNTKDPFKVKIEAQNPEYVFPETLGGNDKKIFVYHIAIPRLVDEAGERYELDVESHYPGLIKYSRFSMSIFTTSKTRNGIESWKIGDELTDDREDIETGVPFPLVVHIPNSSGVRSWEGIDDLSEHIDLFRQIDRRLSAIGLILDKHADPAIMLPEDMMGTDEDGMPVFNVAKDKAIGVSKDDTEPKYLTWNGHLQSAFQHLDALIDQLLVVAELPPVALGKDNSGTSGSSGSAILARMHTIISKTKRKRQYFDEGLKQVLYIAQLLEHERSATKPNYEPTIPRIQFKDGLPKDAKENALIGQIRTGAAQTISRKTFLMETEGLSEAQAESELERIFEEERKFELTVPSLTDRDPLAYNPRDEVGEDE